MTEEWRPVIGYEGLYEVSDLGRVRSLDRVVLRSNGAPHPWKGQILKPSAHPKNGHLSVRLYQSDRGRTLEVHRLVGEAFLGPLPPGRETRHFDGDPANNRVRNLVYGTKSENNDDRVRHGTHHNSKKTHCPRNHGLVAPNLVASIARRGGRTCLACSRARDHARKSGTPFSDEYANEKYAEILGAMTKENRSQ